LPEAQIDRFLFRLLVGNVDVDVLNRIIATRRRGEPPPPTWTMRREDLSLLFSTMDRIFLPQPVARYVARLVAATHPAGASSSGVRDYCAVRGLAARRDRIAEAARACALLDAAPPSALRTSSGWRARHESPHHLNYKARFDKVDTSALLNELVAGLEANRDGSSRDVVVEGAAR